MKHCIGMVLAQSEPQIKGAEVGYRVIQNSGYEAWLPEEIYKSHYRELTDTELSSLALNRTVSETIDGPSPSSAELSELSEIPEFFPKKEKSASFARKVLQEDDGEIEKVVLDNPLIPNEDELEAAAEEDVALGLRVYYCHDCAVTYPIKKTTTFLLKTGFCELCGYYTGLYGYMYSQQLKDMDVDVLSKEELQKIKDDESKIGRTL